MVTMLGKMGNETVIGNAASFGETVHAFSDFDVDLSIVNQVSKVGLVHNLSRDVLD